MQTLDFKAFVELDEGKLAQWLGPAAIGAGAMLGGYNMMPQDKPDAIPDHMAKKYPSVASSTRIGRDASELGDHESQDVYKLAIQLAKKQYGVADADIKVMKPIEYIKAQWGDRWEEIYEKAMRKKLPSQYFNYMPDLGKLNNPVVVVKAKESGALGTCQYYGSVQICTIDPSRWAAGNTETSREELTHSMQRGGSSYQLFPVEELISKIKKYPDIVQKLKTNGEYMLNMHEITAKTAELKRWYFKQTGEVPPNAKEAFRYLRTHKKESPPNILQLWMLDTILDMIGGDYPDRLYNYVDSVMDGLVQKSTNRVSTV